ncbi:hypothetical protein Tco_1417673 [Tanacetum coccineum]
MDVMTIKIDAQYKELQSHAKHPTPDLDEDDMPVSREETAKFMQTFRKTRFYNDYRDRDSNRDNWRSSEQNNYNRDKYRSNTDDKPYDLQRQFNDFMKSQQSTNAFVKDTFMDLKTQLETVAKNIKLQPKTLKLSVIYVSSFAIYFMSTIPKNNTLTGSVPGQMKFRVEPLVEPEQTLNQRLRRRNRRVPFEQRNNSPQHPRVAYPSILDISYFHYFLDILQNYNPMDDEPMWAADRVVAPTLGFAITILETANEFAIKGNHLTLIKENQFDGRTKTDPHKHIHEFLKICDMFKYRDTENEDVLLMMFPLSLTGEAKTQLDELNE